MSCAHCLIETPLFHCGGPCQSATRYCSLACGQAHFKTHANECALIAAGGTKRTLDDIVSYDTDEIIQLVIEEANRLIKVQPMSLLDWNYVYQAAADRKSITLEEVRNVFAQFQKQQPEQARAKLLDVGKTSHQAAFWLIKAYTQAMYDRKADEQRSVYAMTADIVNRKFGFNYSSVDIAAFIGKLSSDLARRQEANLPPLPKNSKLAYYEDALRELEKRRILDAQRDAMKAVQAAFVEQAKTSLMPNYDAVPEALKYVVDNEEFLLQPFEQGRMAFIAAYKKAKVFAAEKGFDAIKWDLVNEALANQGYSFDQKNMEDFLSYLLTATDNSRVVRAFKQAQTEIRAAKNKALLYKPNTGELYDMIVLSYTESWKRGVRAYDSDSINWPLVVELFNSQLAKDVDETFIRESWRRKNSMQPLLKKWIAENRPR